MPMSKNTGMPMIKPVRPIASGAPLGPNSLSSRVASTSAPPDRSMIAPSTVPNPMIGAMCPRMPPKPFSSSESADLIGVPTRSAMGTPPISATARPTTINAMNGSSLTLMISSSSTATLSTASVSRPDVSFCNQFTNPPMAYLSPAVPSAAAKVRARSVISDQAPASTAAGGTTLVPAQTASAPAAR